MLILILACAFPPRADQRQDPPGSTPAGAVEGQVVDDGGAPVSGALITSQPGGLEAVADAEGRFTFARVMPGDYSVVVASEGWATAWSEPFAVVEGQTTQVVVDLSVGVPTDGVLTVRVHGPHGEPWAGAEVSAQGDTTVSGTTDDAGEVRLAGLGGQDVQVEVVDGTGRLSSAARETTVPTLGGELLAFTLAGLPAPQTGEVGSVYCSYCHRDEGAALFSSAHGEGLSPVNAVPWSSTPQADGLVGGPLRGAVPYVGDVNNPLPRAWVPAHPERGQWSGLARGDVPWTPPLASSPEGDCQSCHTSGSEQGVSCERCHGAGEEHAYAIADRRWSITNPARLEAADENALCGECHSAPTFEAWPSGAAAVSGAQVDELEASGHYTGGWSARCSDCHDPHTGGLKATVDDNALCLSCHGGLGLDSQEAVVEHTGHLVYGPQNAPASSRCVGCHMPETTARLAWSDGAGAGDLSSHLFVALAPAETLAAFDAAGRDGLDPWEYPANACISCHNWNDWLFRGGFPGPSGDPSLRATHEALQQAYEELWP